MHEHKSKSADTTKGTETYTNEAFTRDCLEIFRRKEVIGVNYFGPYEWLPDARSVAALLLPFSETVRTSNKEDKTDPSREWLYARIEGQEFISKYMAAIRQFLKDKSIDACVPALDERFGVKIEMTLKGVHPDFHADSRWSERHAAYACGLGTFGLSRGFITTLRMRQVPGGSAVRVPLAGQDAGPMSTRLSWQHSLNGADNEFSVDMCPAGCMRLVDLYRQMVI